MTSYFLTQVSMGPGYKYRIKSSVFSAVLQTIWCIFSELSEVALEKCEQQQEAMKP